MKIKLKFAALALSTLCLLASSSQALTINLNAGYLYDATGTATGDRLALGSTVMLIADLDGSGWASYTNGTWTGDTWALGTDLVLGRWALDGTLDGAGTTGQALTPDVSGVAGWDPGTDQLALLWFEQAYSAGAAGPGASQHFGFYRSSTVTDPSGSVDMTYVAEANNFNGFLQTFSAGASGNAGPDSTFNATFQTQAIPEPSSLAFVGLGMLTLVTVMRRRKQ
jgi:hypothetical protein